MELKPQKETEYEEPGVVSENSNVVLWLFPGHTMPRFVQLLSYPDYRYNVVKGLIVSGGELTESLVSGFFFVYFLAAPCPMITNFTELFSPQLRERKLVSAIN